MFSAWLLCLLLCQLCNEGVDGQDVAIVTDPAGTPVDGQPGTRDYPILTSVTLTCMATASDGSSVTVNSYSWTATNCYARNGGVQDPCFYSVGDPTGQNVTSSGVLATDAGTVTCTATIDGVDYTSDPLTLRISGVALTGGTEGTIAGGMGDGSNFPRAANVLDDYTYILLDGSEADNAILFRCATGLGPSGSNDLIGDMYHNNVLLTDQMCNGFVIAQGVGNVFRFPGVYQARTCGTLTTSTEGIYTCTLTNSSMMDQSVSIGVYLSTRTAPVITTAMSSSSLAAVNVLGSNITLTCTSSGSPPDTFTWMKDGVPVTQSTNITTVTYTNTMAVFSSSYTISNVSVSDNGTYTCTVTNPIGSDNNNFTINIPQPIATIPAMVSVSEGESVTITCTATGVPVPSVNWSRADGSSLTDSRYVISDTSSPMVVNEVYQVTRNLTIMNIVRGDIGVEYGCTVTNVVDTVQSNVSIIVLFDSTISPEVMDEIQDEGGAASFTCQATGGPVPTISWYFNGALLADGATHTISVTSVNTTTINSTLTIMSVQSSDVGTYTCNATNVVSSDTSSGVLTVNVAPNIIAPMEEQQFNITEGSNGSITCTATGYPVPTVVWQNSDGSSLSNNRLVSGSPVNILSTGVGNVTSVSVELMVIGAMRVDTGMYRCSANNSVNSTTRNININVQFTPTISPEVMDEIQDEGGAASFTCQTTGEPFPTVSWYFNGALLADGATYTISETSVNTTTINSTLTIMSVQSSDVGTYTCNATNVVSSDTSSGVLTVNVAPNIATPMEGQLFNITEGSNGSITCTATGYPVPTVVWQNSDGSSLSNNRLVSGSPVISPTGVGNVTNVSVELMVIGAMRVDTGMYRCSANNSVSSTTRNISITVQFNSTITFEVLDQTENETNTASFTCEATGEPVPTISWYFNGALLADGATHTISVTSVNTTTINSTLTIMSVQSSDVGTYTCNATNVVSSDTSSGVLTVNVAPNITTPMEGQQFNITEGSNGSITCTATGYPVPTVVWQNSDGSSLSNNRLVSGSPVNMPTDVGNVTSVSVELMVIGAMRVDTEMYRCSANNSVDSTTRNINIIVQFNSTITFEVLDQTENETNTASFTCEATGEPVPTISWYFNGALLADGATHAISETSVNTTTINSTLTIMSVQSSDVGTYTCNATNVVSSDTSSGVLTVNVAPNIITLMEGQQFSITEGSNGSITCTTTGYPVPTVVWQNSDGSSLSNNRLVSGSPVNMPTGVGNVTNVSVELMVMGAMRVDTGMYRCSANNGIGGDAAVNISLTILFTPTISPEVLDETQNEGGTASFTCQATGEPVPTISWYFNGNPISNDTDVDKYDISETSVNTTTINSTLTIMSVQSSDVGTYTCNATNVVSSDNSSGVLTVNVAANIATPMEGQQFNITEGSDGSITCTATGYPVPTVVWQNSDGSSLSNNRLVSGSPVISSTGVGNVTSVSVELMVIRAMRVDTRIYRCSANNSVSNTTRNINITIQFGPDIIELMNETQNEGGIASFTCQADGEPLPTISWYFNSAPLDESNTAKYMITERQTSTTTNSDILTIMSVESSDAGAYTCNATNVVSSSTRFGVLTVNVAPNITTPMEEQQFNITEGSNGSITCTATGYPVPTVVWQNSDGSSLSNNRLVSSSPVNISPTGVGNVTSVSVELMVIGAMRVDTGMYRCSANNSIGSNTTNISLTIQFIPDISPEVMNETQDEGDTASFACQATGEPVPTISWYFNGALLADGATHTISETSVNTTTINSTLTIMSVQSSDVGTYTCNATNVVSNDTSFGILTVNVAPNITTPMEGQQFNITERSNGSITCTATGYPVPTVVWQNSDGSSLSNNRLVSGSPVNMPTGVGNVTSVSVELMVIGAMRVDTGMYRCSATNRLNSTTRNINITIQFAPEIIIPPNNTTVVNGSEAVLNCTVVGDPLPSISWFVVSRVNVSLLFSIGLMTPFDQQGRIDDIVIDNTILNNTAIHSSMTLNETASFIAGDYACRASNSLGNINRTATLTVHVPPTVITPNGSRVVTDEETANFPVSCTAAGIPPPNITWSDPNGMTLPNDRIILEDHTTPELMTDDGFTFLYYVTRNLVITNTSDSDTGNYTCIADNDVVAEDNNTVEVFIRVVPVITAPPTNLTVVSPNGATFNCTAIAKPRAVIQWTINNGMVLTGTMSKFTITDTTEGDCIISNPPSECMITSTLDIADNIPNDSGQYVCTAINDAGNDTTSALLTVHVEPVILQPTNGSVFTINETDTYDITCNATGIPEPMTFIWLKDEVVQNYSVNTDRISVSQPSDPVLYSTTDGVVQSVSQVLTISSAEGDDSGMYTCQVSNGVGDDVSVTVELVVQVPPLVVPESSSVIGVEGNSSVLRFNVTNAFPPVTIDNVRWLLDRDGIITDITNDTMIDNNTLTFEFDSTTQIYSLTISDIQPNYTSRFNLSVSNPAGVDTNFIYLIVEGPPDIVVGPTSTIEIDDNNVTLKCDAIALPQHNITWMFQRTNTAGNARMIINTSSPDPNMKYLIDDNVNSSSFGTLTITNLQYSDRGMYICVAANVHGADIAEAMVNVHVMPTNDSIFGGARINISSQVNLTCTVIGVPLPAIVWQLNGNDIILPSDCVLNSYNASLDFESGSGVPDCRINQTLNLLDDVVANAVSDPQDIITLGMYELSQLVVKSNLIIRSLERGDNGSYTCAVTNMLPETDTISIVTDSTPVVVLERPDPIQNVTVEDQGSRWAFITWNIPYSGNSEIMGYIVYIRSDSDFVPVTTSTGGKRQAMPLQYTTTNTSYNVTEDILPAMQYQFIVVACNELGCGEMGQPSPTVRAGEERPETPPMNCEATAIGSTTIMIMWSPPAMPNGIITNYNVSYVPGQSLSTADHSADGNISVAIGNNDTIYNVSSLRIATNYYVAIAAHTIVGIGPYSSDNCTVQTMEDVPVGPPLNVTLTSPSSTSISVNWDLPDPLSRNGIITKHQLNYTEVSQPLNWINVSLDASTSYLIEGLKIFTQYYVSVSAGTQIPGFGPFSDPVIYRTLNDTPSAPRSPQIISTGKKTLQLSWTEPEILNGIIQKYRIYYDPSKNYMVTSNDFNDSVMSIETPDNKTSYTIMNLTPDTTYTVNLSAFTGAGEGDFSVSITNMTIRDLPPTPPRPTLMLPPGHLMGIAQVADNKFTLIFTRPSNINGMLDRHEIVIVVFANVNDANAPSVNSSMFPENTNTPDDAYATVTTDGTPAAFVAIRLQDEDWSNGVFVIGDDTAPTSSNRPLRTGFAYRAFIRAYPSNAGEQSSSSSSSPLSDVFENPSPPSASDSGFPIGIVIGVLVAVALAVVVIIILICICYRRRKSQKELTYSPSILVSSSRMSEFSEKDSSTLGIVAAQSNAGEIGLTTFRNTSGASHAPIAIINFSSHVEKLFANDKYGFSEEYKEIQETSPKHESDCFSMPVNKQKNRYQNIVCFDHSRVKLMPFDTSEGSDYIHANYLPGYTHPKEYIGCQGPLPGTIADFWRMIWEQECPTIVMLTGLVEKMKIKCSQYWPNNGSAAYGNITVTLDGSVQYADYVVRTLRVQLEGDDNVRTIKLFHFTAWPDFGVPLHATPLLGFIHRIRQHHRYGDHRPLLIHCSAGVGRTGTLIVVDVELQRARKESIVDPFGCVMKLRENRSNIVQTEAQYIFLHDAILEGVESGKTDVPADRLRSHVENLSQLDKSTGETGFENEFRRLTNRIDVSKFTIGSKDVNKFKNRLVNVLPYDHCRVMLEGKPGDEGSDYINASFIDGYHQKAAYIVTQGPLQNTCGDFWRMIWEKRIASIVMLTKLTEKGTDMCAPYWPNEKGQTLNFNDYIVELLDVKEFEDYTQRELKLTKETQTVSDSHTVIQYHYTGWPEHGSPSSGAGMIDLIGQVIKRQQHSHNQPVVVHCSAGVGRSGAFCAISTAIERVKAEGTVDIFHGVKHLRTQRPHMVQTSEQYIFCYHAVLEYVESLDSYSNFK